MRTTTFLLFILLLAFIACNSKQPNEPAQAARGPVTTVDPATAAAITGTVKFDGNVPAPQKIDMSLDSACGFATNTDESLVVNSGNLQNVFVYVKDGLAGKNFPVPSTPVKIDQQGCRYHPHVLGAMAGQTVQIVNDDDTTHNIHPMPTQSKQWNESQLPKAEPIVKTFNSPELMIPIKCNQHPWMRMYLNVVSSPFFAVSAPDGKFEITGLPPGDYTLAAVHEKLGEQTLKIHVGPKESKTADFSFKAQ
jgi:plastocyanin